MYKKNIAEGPRRERDGLVTDILLQKGDIADTELSVTWVTLSPNGAQSPHSHAPEQVYVIIQGTGEITIGDEVQPVERGDLVHIPPNEIHEIKNTGDTDLIYVSASTPAFDFEEIYDTGELSE